MWATYKYARRKYTEHQAAKSSQPLGDDGQQPNSGTPPALPLTASPPASSPFSTPNSGRQLDLDQEKSKQPTAEEIAEKKRRRSYRLKIIFGLFAPYTLQALDTTVIASAFPFIAMDFNEISQLNWIITSFNLTSAAFLPFWAQIADVFGRYATLQSTLVIIIIGSALCTAAPNTSFPVLLLGRALQGVGAAGINISVRTILADRVSLAEYAKNWSIFAILAAVSFSIGPVVGGYLTKVSWRWCFAINLPVGVIAMGLVFWLLRGELVGAAELFEGKRETKLGRFRGRIATIDYGGQLLFLWGLGLLVLGLTWAGGVYAWESVSVLVPLVMGGVLTFAWLVYEWAMVPGRKMARVFPAQKAMMPWKLLAQRDVGLLLCINFTVGAAMYSVMYFMDLYFTLVKGHSASEAGVALLYFLPGLGAGVYSAVFFVNVWPRQTMPVLCWGSIASAVGISVLPYACHIDNTPLVYGMMALAGYGVGTNTNPGSLHGLAFFPHLTAAISCIVTFAVPFGGTVALTIMSTVFNNRSGVHHADPRTGIVWGFITLIPIMWVGVLSTTFLGNVWVRKAGGHEVVHGVWVWNLLRGRTLQRVIMTGNEDAEGRKAVTVAEVRPKESVFRDVESGYLRPKA